MRETNQGYILWDKQREICLEFSRERDAYSKFIEQYQELLEQAGTFKFLVESGRYMVRIDSGLYITLNSDGTIDEYVNKSRSIYLNMTPYIQPSYCIPAAAAHILVYYSNSYTRLPSGFNSVATSIESLMTNPQATASLPAALASYGTRYGYNISLTSYAAPSFLQLCNFINAGKPVLLGYSSANGFYLGAHMTAACGYDEISSVKYAIVCDGHTASRIYRAWGSYNDYIHAINIS